MGILEINDKQIMFQQRDEIVAIEAFGKNTLRFCSSPTAVLRDESWNLLPQDEVPCDIKLEKNKAIIKNGSECMAVFE